MIAVQTRMNNMRWDFITKALLCAFLGALFGFAALLFADMIPRTASSVSIPSDIPPPVSDGPGYVLTYSSEGRTLGTPYASVDGTPQYPKNLAAKDFRPNANQQGQWRQLWYQLAFWDWLQQNGARAAYFAAFTALVVAWIVFGVDRWQQRPKA